MFFPIFIDLSHIKVLVVGAGAVGLRRIKVLKQYGAMIDVISVDISEEIDGVNIELREYRKGDIDESYSMVIASTDNDELNSLIIKDAVEAGVAYYNNAGRKKESNFYFPAVIENDEIICGLISKNGHNHRKAKEIADILREKI